MIQVNCPTLGCHQRKKVSPEELQMLRTESERSGPRADLIRPACVKRAFDDPDDYDLDIPVGELVVEAAKENPRCRLLLVTGLN